MSLRENQWAASLALFQPHVSAECILQHQVRLLKKKRSSPLPQTRNFNQIISPWPSLSATGGPSDVNSPPNAPREPSLGMHRCLQSAGEPEKGRSRGLLASLTELVSPRSQWKLLSHKTSDGSSVKSTSCSSRRPEFDPKHSGTAQSICSSSPRLSNALGQCTHVPHRYNPHAEHLDT